MSDPLENILTEEQLLQAEQLFEVGRDPAWDGLVLHDGGDVVEFSDATTRDLPSYRLKWFNPRSGQLTSVRSISLAEARRHGAKRFAKEMFVVKRAVCGNGELVDMGAVLLGAQGASHFCLHGKGRFVVEAEGQPIGPIAAFVSYALSQRYQWRVVIRQEESRLSVAIPTDPIGAREAFRLRDAPPGAKRRTALRNWVQQHYRKRRNGEDQDLVQRHLRGETKFHWNGLECELIPSDYDRECEIARKAAS